MRAVFLIFLLIAFIAMAMATVHHHTVQRKETDNDEGGSIFDAAASLANGILG